MGDGTERIEDEELLYRRVPIVQFNRTAEPPHPFPVAFRPKEVDTLGLSVTRAKYISSTEFAKLGQGKQYYVAVLCAGDLREHGIEVEPRPIPGQPGHAELPGLTWDNRKNDDQELWQVLMAKKLCLDTKGPYPGNTCEGSG